MSESGLEVQIPENVIDLLTGLTIGESFEFGPGVTHGLVANQIYGQARVFGGMHEFGDLHMMSVIGIDSPELHRNDVDLFRGQLEFTGARREVTCNEPQDLNVTNFYQHIRGFDRQLSGIVLPFSSDEWYVNTVGPNLWEHGYEKRWRWAEAVATLHVNVVNALLRAASQREHTVDDSTEHDAHRVIYLVPKITDEQEENAAIEEEPEWSNGGVLPLEHHFSNFVGIDAVVRELCDVVEIANATEEELQEFGLELSQAILLVGPSGVGKTGLAGGFAEALGADEVINVNFSDISGIYIGEWGRNVDEIFTEAYKKSANGRVVIFMDELDGLANTGNQAATQNVTTVFKKQLEEIRKHPNVFFIAATNEPDLIDPVIRADKRMTKIMVPNLSESGRQELLRKLIFPEPSGIESSTASAVAETLIEAGDLEAELSVAETRGFDLLAALPELSGQLADFSPGDIREVVAQVRRNLFLEAKRAGLEPREASRQDFLAAIDKAKKNRA